MELGTSFVCNVLNTRVPGQRRLDGDLRRLDITDLAHQDDIRVLAENGT